MSEQDTKAEMVEIPAEKYHRLEEARSQLFGEDWMDVARIDDEPIRARAVERQNGRTEGELITSDSWLIEDVNGETYTVSDQTFEEKYDSVVTEQFVMDLSIDPVETEDDVPEIGGREVVAEVTAHVDLAQQSITSLFIDRVSIDGTVVDSLPLELMKDHEDISSVETEEDNE